jgi:nucleoside-diphosphate-sugar epimerase
LSYNNCEIIFGSDGLIGLELKKIKSKNLFTVSRKKNLKKKNHFTGDINNLSFISKIHDKIKRQRFKNIIIYYLAGHSRTKYNVKKPDLIIKKSISKLINVLNTFKGKNVKIIIASSGSVYKPIKQKLTETSKVEPTNFYSSIKFLEENIAREFSRNYGTQVIVGRIFSILSLNANNFFINDLKKKIASNNNTLTFFGSGKQGRDYLEIKDVCKALKIISKNGKSDNIYNICSGKFFYMKQIIDFLLSKLSNKKRKVVWDKINKYHENDFYYGSNQKIKKLGFKPKILTLKDLII